jgi:hypothetical protein
MNREIQQQLTWVNLYEEAKDAGLDALILQSCPPHLSPATKITDDIESIILDYRLEIKA